MNLVAAPLKLRSGKDVPLNFLGIELDFKQADAYYLDRLVPVLL